MTTKSIYYYTLTGKTEAALELIDKDKVSIFKLNDINPKQLIFNECPVLIIGSPTYGRGVPPSYFKEILPQLKMIKGRKIGLFGSGNTIYGDDFCGALDVLEEVLSFKNNITFKYKFEGYPRDVDLLNIKNLINEEAD
ncbi:flavodoxin domain-containing protein [Paenibacillus elgii]|uniref:flavodoxin domain-containing protein n=1 Tax=Paenibacillus elgii TaxID=189691 RepID=UPI000248CFB3|nr:flavodoxin domain-containing protein [Paenibacillus elgii]